jgi:uncharacterized protein (DUF1810 family)
VSAGDTGRQGEPRADLERFVLAQESDGTYARALQEIRAAGKRTHWMWFVFPQLAGLGASPTSRHYSIASLDEARAYLEHELLGARLRQCAGALCALGGFTAEQVFGALDAQKLRSSMTLFLRAAPQESLFAEVLERYFDGVADALTDELLAGAGGRPRSGEIP